MGTLVGRLSKQGQLVSQGILIVPGRYMRIEMGGGERGEGERKRRGAAGVEGRCMRGRHRSGNDPSRRGCRLNRWI